MKFFIDTANLDQIKEAKDLGILDGVTTNPSLMAKEGISGAANILNHYRAICEIVDGDVSAEVIATDYKGMIEEGKKLAKLHKNIVVKVPMIKEGVKIAGQGFAIAANAESEQAGGKHMVDVALNTAGRVLKDGKDMAADWEQRRKEATK